MSKIVMYEGETLIIQFADMDGEFTIDFSSRTYPQQLVVRESDGIKGNVKGGAGEILYHGDWREVSDDEAEYADEQLRMADESTPPTQPVGFFIDGESQIRCTALVKCLVREFAGIEGDRVVVVLNADGSEGDTFNFYESPEAMEKALGGPIPRITI